MAITGTPLASSTFSRVSSVLGRDVILGNLQRTQAELLRIQEQLATGHRIVRPSDDPIDANRIIDFSARIGRDDQYLRNVTRGVSRLNTADLAMSQVGELASRAREILLQQVQSTATAQSRQAAAGEVNSLLQQALNLGNTKFEGRYLFGGSRSETAPLALAGGAVAFVGDVRDLNAEVADSVRISTNVSADRAFNVLSDEIRGVNLAVATLPPIDLNPRVTSATKLSALNQGRGVRLGSIQVSATGTATIDLRSAETVGTVIGLINAQTATTGVTASINPASNGLRLTAAGPITVQNVGGGQTATDLGILAAGAASPFDGTDLNPNVTSETLLGDLFGGAGISSSGMVVTNTTSTTTYSATFGASVFGAGVSVGTMLANLNSANVFVDARINSTGTGIDVVNRLSAGRLTVAENGGATASNLGLLSTLGRAAFDDLNGGLGVGSVDGTDVRITKKDGSQVNFDVDSFSNLQGLVNAIDADAGLTASIVGSTIVVTDVTGGAGPLSIDNLNGSFAATNLGIQGSTAGVTITGSALTFVGVQPTGIYTALIRLRDALQANDSAAISRAGKLLNGAQDALIDARGEAGTRVAGLELIQNRLHGEKAELEKLISGARDVDVADAATRFQIQQTILQSSLSVAARIMQTNLLNFL